MKKMAIFCLSVSVFAQMSQAKLLDEVRDFERRNRAELTGLPGFPEYWITNILANWKDGRLTFIGGVFDQVKAFSFDGQGVPRAQEILLQPRETIQLSDQVVILREGFYRRVAQGRTQVTVVDLGKKIQKSFDIEGHIDDDDDGTIVRLRSGLLAYTARYYSDSRLYFFDPSSYHGRVVRSVELPKGARGRGITQMTNGNLMVESSQGTSFFSEAGDPLKVKLLQCKQNTHTQCFALKNGKILLMTSRLWFWDLTTGHHERVELTQVKEGSLDLRHVAELGNGNLMLISRDYMKDQGRILIADRGGKVLREYEGAVFEAPTKLRDGRLLVSSQRGELMYFSAADGQLEKCESLAGVTDHPNEFWKFQTTQTYPWTNTFSINSGDQQTSLRFTFLNDGVYVSSKDYSYLPLFDGAILVSNGKDGFQPAIAPVSYLNKLYRVKARECAR